MKTNLANKWIIKAIRTVHVRLNEKKHLPKEFDMSSLSQICTKISNTRVQLNQHLRK